MALGVYQHWLFSLFAARIPPIIANPTKLLTQQVQGAAFKKIRVSYFLHENGEDEKTLFAERQTSVYQQTLATFLFRLFSYVTWPWMGHQPPPPSSLSPALGFSLNLSTLFLTYSPSFLSSDM